MNKRNVCIILLLFSLRLSAQENLLTKEKFRENIASCFPGATQIHLINAAVFHIDTAYHLPAPIHKALVIAGEKNDSLFFYYYSNPNKDSVLQNIFHWTWKADALHYKWEAPFSDSALKTSLIWFYPNHLDTLEVNRLSKSIAASFGFTQDVITVELIEVREEEKRVEPPPPPPPKPSKRKRKKQ